MGGNPRQVVSSLHVAIPIFLVFLTASLGYVAPGAAPYGTRRMSGAEVAVPGVPVGSPVLAIGSVAGRSRFNQAFWDDPELTFHPPVLTELFKDSRFQMIRRVVVNLPSGIETSNDLHYYIPADDTSILKVHVIMSPLMSNARMIHRDILGAGTRAQQNEHARVVNYKCKLDSHRPSTGGRPWWTATIQLPEQLASTNFLRNQLVTDKQGNCKLLCLDLLAQESVGGPSNQPEFELPVLDSDTDTDEDDVFN